MCPTNQKIISLDISTTTKQKSIGNTQKRIRKEYKYSIKGIINHKEKEERKKRTERNLKNRKQLIQLMTQQ